MVSGISLRRGIVGLCFCALSAFSGTASADPAYTGELWVVTNTQASNASQAEIATLGAADVTFTASAVDFSSFGNLANTGNGSLDYTIASYLNSLGSASGITLTSAGSTAGVSLGQSLDLNGGGIIIDLTGTASFTNGQAFTVAHDDGVTFVVGGSTILSAAGPTSPTTTPFTYTGLTGNQAFNFAYGECCGPPAVLETTLVPAQVPEPASIAILGAGLIGLGVVRRWRAKV